MVLHPGFGNQQRGSIPTPSTIKILTAIFIDYNTDDIRFTNIFSILFNIAESYNGSITSFDLVGTGS